MIPGLLILIAYQLVGELISYWLNWPIPGPVVGMLLLLASLRLGAVLWPRGWLVATETAGKALIDNLSLLFLPAGVGIFFLPDHIQAQWPAVLAAIVLATFISMVLCAILLRWLGRHHD